MKQKMDPLCFAELREANMKRLPLFKNAHGELAHTNEDGSDWSPAEWLQAVVGELGEYANFRKKFQRGDITLEEFKVHAAKELADVQTYLDILARRCLDTPGFAHPTGIDLGRATREKFNEVSRRVGCEVFLHLEKEAAKPVATISFIHDLEEGWYAVINPLSRQLVNCGDWDKAVQYCQDNGLHYNYVGDPRYNPEALQPSPLVRRTHSG